MNKLGFPIELLDRTVKERVDYFKKRTVGHPNLQLAYLDLMDKIEIAGKGKVLLVYGPSGVGKSTLFRKVKEEITKQYRDEMNQDKGFFPVIGVEATSPEDGKFDWIDFYTESLHEVEEILINEKRLPNDHQAPKNNNQRAKRALRRALENVIKYRKVKLILIDEAQHMTKAGKSETLRNHMDTIKSLASKFEIPIILFGTYELLSFRNLSGQLSRRGLDVHFPRYNAELTEEITAYKNVLGYFQVHLPLQNQPDLINNWEYFYQRTIGCVGILRDWLRNTLDYKLKKTPGATTLTLNDFKKFEPTIDQAYKMADEIISGEDLLESQKKMEHDLNFKLGLGKVKEEVEQKKKTNKKPGVRDPKRDTTGMEYLNNAQ
jgi:archaellum biogenesis ATPase FlaH